MSFVDPVAVITVIRWKIVKVSFSGLTFIIVYLWGNNQINILLNTF